MPDEDFDAFFHREFPRVVGFLISLGFGSGLAEDSAAEAMLKAHTKWCELHQPRAWVRTTAKRHAQEYVIRDLDGVRRAVRSGWLPPAEGRDPRPQVEAQLVREQLLKVLPDRQREVMAWTFDGFEPTEIAEAMGLSPDTVRSNLRHAREKLKTEFVKQFGSKQ